MWASPPPTSPTIQYLLCYGNMVLHGMAWHTTLRFVPSPSEQCNGRVCHQYLAWHGIPHYVSYPHHPSNGRVCHQQRPPPLLPEDLPADKGRCYSRALVLDKYICCACYNFIFQNSLYINIQVFIKKRCPNMERVSNETGWYLDTFEIQLFYLKHSRW